MGTVLGKCTVLKVFRCCCIQQLVTQRNTVRYSLTKKDKQNIFVTCTAAANVSTHQLVTQREWIGSVKTGRLIDSILVLRRNTTCQPHVYRNEETIRIDVDVMVIEAVMAMVIVVVTLLLTIFSQVYSLIYLFCFVKTPRKFIIAELLLALMKIRAYGSKALQ